MQLLRELKIDLIQDTSTSIADVVIIFRPPWRLDMNEELIAVDGEDDSFIPMFSSGESITDCMTYYKRELNSEGAFRNAVPISFKFPVSHILISNMHEIKKNRVLQRVILGLKVRMFILAKMLIMVAIRNLCLLLLRRAGWDCLRHYEILVPVLANISRF